MYISLFSLTEPRVDGPHGDVEQQPVTGVDEEQSRLFLREQIVGADGRDDEAERDAKGGQHFGGKIEVHRIGRERVRQCPRGDQAEGEGAAVDGAHITLLDLLLGQADRAHPCLAHDRAIPDAADQKAGQRGHDDRDPVHVEYVHFILPRFVPRRRPGSISCTKIRIFRQLGRALALRTRTLRPWREIDGS